MIVRINKENHRSRAALMLGSVCLLASIQLGAQNQIENKEYYYDVNSNYLGLAYDLVYLNLDNYTAPSFPKPDITIPPEVFDLRRSNDTFQTIDGKTYHLPGGVTGHPGSNEAKFESELEEYRSGNAYRESFKNTLEMSVGVGNSLGIGNSLSISGSKSFKKVKSVTQNSKSRIWRQKGYVKGHQLKLNLVSPESLSFTEDFEKAVANLGSEESYAAFIGKWGTHFASSITYGGKAYLTATLSREDVKETQKTKKEFEQAVAGAFKQVSASIKASQDQSKEEKHEKTTIHEKIEATAYGGNGSVFSRDAPGSFNDWATTVRENPGIYAITLTSYDQLLTPGFFPEDIDIATKKERLRTEITNYLSAHEVDSPETGIFYPSPPPEPASLGGNYLIQQKVNRRYVDAHEKGGKYDFSLVTRSWQNNDSQKWIVAPVANEADTYTIQQKSNLRYVDAHEKGGIYDYKLVTRSRQNNDSQKWIIKAVNHEPNTFTIQQKSNKRFVDAHEHGGKNDYRLVTRGQQNDDSQKWLFRKSR